MIRLLVFLLSVHTKQPGQDTVKQQRRQVIETDLVISNQRCLWVGQNAELPLVFLIERFYGLFCFTFHSRCN